MAGRTAFSGLGPERLALTLTPDLPIIRERVLGRLNKPVERERANVELMAVFTGFEHIVREHESLAPHTWLRLGGTAEYFAEPTSVEDLAGLVRCSAAAKLPVRLLGGGSNLVVRDGSLAGLVVHLSAAAFSAIQIAGTTVTAGGGAKLSHVISAAVGAGLGGLEQLVGIPGTVGGALHGNAGTEVGDIGQWTDSAQVMLRDGSLHTRQRDDLRFGYRESSLDELVILSASFELEREAVDVLTKRLQKSWIVKRATLPRSDQGAAWIFKNPLGSSAASLIEQAGLKNARVGQVEVSGTNANCFVASAGASSREVLELIALVREQVLERTGVQLETQIDIW